MKKLKKYINLIYWVIFSWQGKIWFFYHLKLATLSLFDFVKVPEGKCKPGQVWTQIFFLKYFRSPKVITAFFRKTLRICITYRCNLSCNYCYVKGIENIIFQDMTTSDFLNLVIWAKDKGWTSIRFLGGEPTIHPQFTEMLEICYRNKVYISMSTNNIFSSRIILKLNKSWINFISVSYNLNVLNGDQRSIFRDNLKQLHARKVPFELSYVIGYNDDGELKIFDDARLYRPICIRVSIAIPGLSKQTTIPEPTSNFQLIAYKIFEFQKNCMRLNIPFYIYRPLMPCMFSVEEWQRLKGTFPFVCFTRCPLGAMGDYSATVVVNPDLSIFPCIAVFLKGPNILTFKDRREISNFYKEKIKSILSQSLMESCKSCGKRREFLYDIQKGIDSELNSCYSEMLCQGGCLSFKKETQTLCQLE